MCKRAFSVGFGPGLLAGVAWLASQKNWWIQFAQSLLTVAHLPCQAISVWCLLSLVARCLEIIDVCIWRMLVFMSVVVTVWGSVRMFVV